MLTPEYLANAANSLVKLYQDLETSIIRNMATRIAKYGFNSDILQRQSRALIETGSVTAEVAQMVAAQSGKTGAEITRLFEQSGAKALENDLARYREAGFELTNLTLSPASAQIMRAGLNKTTYNVGNLTRTMPAMTEQAYLRAANSAYMAVANGGLSYADALIDAVESLADYGAKVLYPSRRHDYADVAIRRSVMTGINQTAAQIQLETANEMGADYVETTSHNGARPDHVVWQGKVFHIGGAVGNYADFYTATGYGSAAGLCGVNCRHNFFPFFPGFSTPEYAPERLQQMEDYKVGSGDDEMSYYDATQKQRKYERTIRDEKRKVLALGDAAREVPDAGARAKLDAQISKHTERADALKREYKEFSENHTLPPQYGRTYVKGFDSGK